MKEKRVNSENERTRVDEVKNLVFFSLLTDKYAHLALYFLCYIVTVYAQTEREGEKKIDRVLVLSIDFLRSI